MSSAEKWKLGKVKLLALTQTKGKSSVLTNITADSASTLPTEFLLSPQLHAYVAWRVYLSNKLTRQARFGTLPRVARLHARMPFPLICLTETK